MVAKRQFTLRGGNSRAFTHRRSGELICSGAAGTGKTLANLLHLLWYGEQYPGARMLIVRKTRVSLTESALVTWERDVLGDGNPILGHPINRSNRHQYRFPNGSVLVTGGMDRPDKILSTEWDLIYVPEATDLTILDWETLAGRLRAGAGPYDLIFGDCNPTTPAHWIYKRSLSGKLTLIQTSHKDNPRYWDREKNDYTEAGRRYVVDRLGAMTGARRKRFLEGEWAAAEGLVYDGYDPAIHNLPVGWEPPANWPRYWSIDWGFIDPLVILFAAIDPQGRVYVYREIYRSHFRVELAAKQCKELVDSFLEPRPAAIFADHDPENVANFREHSGFSVRMADKADRDKGIQLVQGLFDLRPDHRPRIFFRPDSRRHQADTALESDGRPTCLLEELIGYTWDSRDPDKPKDEPIPFNDHAMDSLRYLCMGAIRGTSVLSTGDSHRPHVPDHTYQ